MGARPFLLNTFWGLLVVSSALGYMGFVRAVREPHPDYQRYLDEVNRYNELKADRAVHIDEQTVRLKILRVNGSPEKLAFENSLASKDDSIDVTLKDRHLQSLVGWLRAPRDWHNNSLPERMRMVAENAMASGNPYVRCEKWVVRTRVLRKPTKHLRGLAKTDHIPDGCTFTGPASVLNEPGRLLRLLAHDRTAITREPGDLVVHTPQALHLAFPRQPAYKTNLSVMIDPRQIPMSAPAAWCLMASLFALGFCISGGKAAFTSVPNFALGWGIVAISFPGFALMHGLRALVLPLSSLRLRTTPAPIDEYDDLVAQAGALRNRATELGAPPTVYTRLDEALRAVTDHRNAAAQAELRAAVDQLHVDISAMGDANATIEPLPVTPDETPTQVDTTPPGRRTVIHRV